VLAGVASTTSFLVALELEALTLPATASSKPAVLIAGVAAFDPPIATAFAETLSTDAVLITGVAEVVMGVRVTADVGAAAATGAATDAGVTTRVGAATGAGVAMDAELLCAARLLTALLAESATLLDPAIFGSVTGAVGFVTSTEPAAPNKDTALATDDFRSEAVVEGSTLFFAEEPLSCGTTTCGTTGTTCTAALTRTLSRTEGVATEGSTLFDEAFFFSLSGLDVFFVSTFCAFTSLASPLPAAAATVAPITAEKLLWRLPSLTSAALCLPVASGTAFINWLSIFTFIVIATLWPN